MSYAFDVLKRALSLPAEKQTEAVRIYTVDLVEEMHSANHRLGDAVNKDSRVTRTAQDLDNAVQAALVDVGDAPF